MEAGGSSLGNGITAPFQGDFVQVNELLLEECGGGFCFGISEALRNVFLPHRARVTQGLLEGPRCGEPPLEPPQTGPVSPISSGASQEWAALHALRPTLAAPRHRPLRRRSATPSAASSSIRTGTEERVTRAPTLRRHDKGAGGEPFNAPIGQ